MRVLLIGSGGREHAIGWKLAQSPLITELISCPGNPGLAELGPIEQEVSPTDPEGVTDLAKRHEIDLVVVGPEAPLAAGVADALIDADIAVFGPKQAGAMLESSKAFAKEIMDAAGVPTAAHETFDDRDEANAYLRSIDGPYVVKADGLAAGKGVLVTADRTAAMGWVDACFSGQFGEAGERVVIEEHLDGDEVSTFFICSGGVAVPLEPARDYKRLLDGDEGPNTGGMGSYSPISNTDDYSVGWAGRNAVEPTLRELAGRGVDYTGFLYVGLMLTADGPKVLEFNCRLGDPETQVLMPRLDTDLLELLHAGAHGALGGADLSWSGRHAVDVVLAAPGYPGQAETGLAIIGLERVSEALVFHAGTAYRDGRLVNTGGRVVNVVGIGDTTAEARSDAYAAANLIQFRGKQLRADIAQPQA
ncbi:MAG: phosphoribosylamine--glycine ligase [Acidimicrobiia bacterium]|nr:phosphoribosylamine--glycine ligase [Acidimicrobiia bacterium]